MKTGVIDDPQGAMRAVRHHLFSGVAVTLLGALLAGLSSAAVLSSEQYENFVTTGWSQAVPATEATIVAKFGKPQKTARQVVANRQVAGQADQKVELTYAKLSVNLYETPDSQLITAVVLSDPAISVPHGLGIGIAPARVVEALGPAKKRTNDRLVYQSREGLGAARVTFWMTKGRVARIEWNNPPD